MAAAAAGSASSNNRRRTAAATAAGVGPPITAAPPPPTVAAAAAAAGRTATGGGVTPSLAASIASTTAAVTNTTLRKSTLIDSVQPPSIKAADTLKAAASTASAAAAPASSGSAQMFRGQTPKPFASQYAALTDIPRLLALGMLYFQHNMLSDSILAFDRAVALATPPPPPAPAATSAPVPPPPVQSAGLTSPRGRSVKSRAKSPKRSGAVSPLPASPITRRQSAAAAAASEGTRTTKTSAAAAAAAVAPTPATTTGAAAAPAADVLQRSASVAALTAVALQLEACKSSAIPAAASLARNASMRAADAASAAVPVTALPASADGCWPRALTLYYLGRYRDAANQFARDLPIHRDDTEESIWHVVCRSHVETAGFESAHRAYVPVPDDPRPLLQLIGQLFSGKLTPDKLKQIVTSGEHARAAKSCAIAGAIKSDPTADRFYTNFYLGLYYEARAVTADPNILTNYFAAGTATTVAGCGLVNAAPAASLCAATTAAATTTAACAFLRQSIACMTAAANSDYRRTPSGRDDFMCSVALIHCLRRGVLLSSLNPEVGAGLHACTIGVVQEIALELGKNQTHFYCLDTETKWPLTVIDFNRYQRESLLGNPSATNNLGFCYVTGQGSNERNHSKAIAYFTEAANAAVAAAALNRATSSAAAAVASGSTPAAAAPSGSATSDLATCDVALNNIAVCYACGIGVSRDRARAYQLFSALAARTPHLPALTPAEYSKLFEVPAGPPPAAIVTPAVAPRRLPQPAAAAAGGGARIRLMNDDDDDDDRTDSDDEFAHAGESTAPPPDESSDENAESVQPTSSSSSAAPAAAAASGYTPCGGAAKGNCPLSASVGCPGTGRVLMVPHETGHGRLMAMVNLGTLVRDEIVFDAMSSHKAVESIITQIGAQTPESTKPAAGGSTGAHAPSNAVRAISNELLISEGEVKGCPKLQAQSAAAAASAAAAGGSGGCTSLLSSAASAASSAEAAEVAAVAVALGCPLAAAAAASAACSSSGLSLLNGATGGGSAAASSACNSLRFSESLAGFGPTTYDSGDYVTLERRDNANMKQAMNWYERVLRLTNGEYAPALCKLALYFATEDKPRSRWLLDRARALGHLNALYVHALDVGSSSSNGVGANAVGAANAAGGRPAGNLTHAVELMEHCARAGYAPACVTLAAWCRTTDLKQTVCWLSKAVANGSPDAQFELAIFNLKGTGMKRNIPHGLNMLRELAAAQHARSQLELARYYADGMYGLHSEIRTALQFLEQAAKNGRAEAQFMLAGWLLEGTSTQQQMPTPKAITSSFSSAAAAGACSSVITRAPSASVASDMERAVNWLTAAALQEHDLARQLLTVLHHLNVKCCTGHQTKLMIWRLIHSANTAECDAERQATCPLFGGSGSASSPSACTKSSSSSYGASSAMSDADPPSHDAVTTTVATDEKRDSGHGLVRTGSGAGAGAAHTECTGIMGTSALAAAAIAAAAAAAARAEDEHDATAAAAAAAGKKFNSCVGLFRAGGSSAGASSASNTSSGGRGATARCESAARLPQLRDLTVEFWHPTLSPKPEGSGIELSDLLFSLLPYQSGLQELHIHLYSFSPSAASSVASLLRSSHCALASLSFDNSTLSPEMARQLFAALRTNASVTCLSMSNAKFGADTVNDWMNLFPQPATTASTVAAVTAGAAVGDEKTGRPRRRARSTASRTPPPPPLSSGDEAANAGAATTPGSSDPLRLSLLSLQLNTLQLSGVTARTLLNGLLHSSLTSLDLHDNPIGHTGAVAVAALLRQPNCTLATLNLAKCALSDKSLSVISLALERSNKSLTSLDCSHSPFSDAAIATLVTRLHVNTTVYELILSHCSLSDQSVARIASLVADDPCGGVAADASRQSIPLCTAPIGGSCTGYGLGAAWVGGRRLWRLRLHGNPITACGVLAFASILSKDAPLHSLSLNSQLGSIGAICLALKTNHTLHTLQLARHRKMKDTTTCDCACMFAVALDANRTLRKLLSPCGLGRFNLSNPVLLAALQRNKVLCELDDARFIQHQTVQKIIERNRSVEVSWQRVCVTLSFVRATSGMSYCLRTSILSLLPEITRMVAHSCPYDASLAAAAAAQSMHAGGGSGVPPSKKSVTALKPAPFAVDAFMDSKWFKARAVPTSIAAASPLASPPTAAAPTATGDGRATTPPPPLLMPTPTLPAASRKRKSASTSEPAATASAPTDATAIIITPPPPSACATAASLSGASDAMS